MEINSTDTVIDNNPAGIHWGHFGIILGAIVLLLGMTWMEKPALFNLKKNPVVADNADVPHYYPYTPPPEDQRPQVLGATTQPQGPVIINDDGSVSPVNMGQVLGASTQGVQLSLDAIKVNSVPDTAKTVEDYFNNSQKIENGSIDGTVLAAALNSGSQDQINQQAGKIISLRDALQKLPVPEGLAKLQKLKIIQYNSAIQLLQNFTNADQNPSLVNDALQQFLKSQQDLDTENIAVAQKYGPADPYTDLYLNSDGSPAASQTSIDNFGSSQPLKQPQSSGQGANTAQADPSDTANLNNLGLSNAGQ